MSLTEQHWVVWEKAPGNVKYDALYRWDGLMQIYLLSPISYTAPHKPLDILNYLGFSGVFMQF